MLLVRPFRDCKCSVVFLDMMSVQPDLTQQVVVFPQHSASPSPSVDPPNNNYPPVENIYDKPDVGLPIYSDHRLSNGSVLNRSSPELPPPNTPLGMSLRPPTPTNAMESRHSMLSVHLPPNADSEAVTWGSFNHAGGRLVLPESGKSHFLILRVYYIDTKNTMLNKLRFWGFIIWIVACL
jgi:hypothetical protein